jgi:segregation and condensation protein B
MDYAFKKQIIEALIFASDTPLSESRLISLVEELDALTVKKIIDELTQEYHDARRAFTLVRVAGGYQLVTRPEFSVWLKKLFQGRAKTRLSQASLEVMAIIAFKQPISRPQIEAIRGTNCDGVVKNLLERNLITIAGRSEALGRALLYKTTDEFLHYFGINQITDLPRPKEIKELVGDQDDMFESLSSLSGQLGQRDLFSELMSREEKKLQQDESENPTE